MDNKNRIVFAVSFLSVVGLLFFLYSFAHAQESDCTIILKRDLTTHKFTNEEIRNEFLGYVKFSSQIKELTGCEVS